MGEGEPKGPGLNIYFLIPDSTGLDRKVTMDKAMVDSKNGKAFPKNVEWRFTGSILTQPDPNKNEKVYGADFSGTLIAIFPVTRETAQHEGPVRSTIHHNPTTTPGAGEDGSQGNLAPAGQGKRPALPRNRPHGYTWGRRRTRRTSNNPTIQQSAPADS